MVGDAPKLLPMPTLVAKESARHRNNGPRDVFICKNLEIGKEARDRAKAEGKLWGDMLGAANKAYTAAIDRLDKAEWNAYIDLAEAQAKLKSAQEAPAAEAPDGAAEDAAAQREW